MRLILLGGIRREALPKNHNGSRFTGSVEKNQGSLFVGKKLP